MTQLRQPGDFPSRGLTQLTRDQTVISGIIIVIYQGLSLWEFVTQQEHWYSSFLPDLGHGVFMATLSSWGDTNEFQIS